MKVAKENLEDDIACFGKGIECAKQYYADCFSRGVKAPKFVKVASDIKHQRLFRCLDTDHIELLQQSLARFGLKLKEKKKSGSDYTLTITSGSSQRIVKPSKAHKTPQDDLSRFQQGSKGEVTRKEIEQIDLMQNLSSRIYRPQIIPLKVQFQILLLYY
jgi:hypothetical protein